MDQDERPLAPEAAAHKSELQLTHDAAQRVVHRGPLLFLTVLLLALLGFGAWYGARLQVIEDRELTLALRTLPQVEPFELQKVSEEVAREKNAALPMTTAPVPAAKSFAFGETGSDAQRAVDCLAATVYYEAANEPVAGQMAVIQVVLNRVRHPAFPKSVCGVVFQGHERRTGCQFSFTCDGSLARQPSQAAWERYRALATSMLNGAVYAPVGWATHYHADYVLPYWSASLDKVHVIGRHIFYRWAGAWGTSRAFQAGHARLEALFPKLAMVSPAHRTGDPAIDGQVLASLTTALDPKMVASAAAVSDSEKGQFILRIDPGLDPAILPLLAEQTCGARLYCKVFAWASTSQTPKAFPVQESQLPSMAFSYLRNVEQGFEKPLWNCALYPRADRKQCIRRRVVIEGKVEELIPLTRADEESAPAPTKTGGLRSLSDPDAGAGGTPPVPEAERKLGRRRPGDPGV